MIKRFFPGASALLLFLPVLAHSASTPLDVTAATAQLGEVNTAILSIGGVLFGLAALAVGIKWVKATFFG